MVRRRNSASNKNYRWILVCTVLGSAAVGIAVTPVEQAHHSFEDDIFSHISPPLADYGFYTVYDSRSGRNLNPHSRAASIDFSNTPPKLSPTGFSTEAFHNQGFRIDVTSLLGGHISTWGILKTIWQLDGLGTTNLAGEMNQDLMEDEPHFPAVAPDSHNSEEVPGTAIPLGIRIDSNGLTLKASVTCVLCHATLHPETGRVIEQEPRQDLSVGLLMAVAGNLPAFFSHTHPESPESSATGHRLLTKASHGERQALPNPELPKPKASHLLLGWPTGLVNR